MGHFGSARNPRQDSAVRPKVGCRLRLSNIVCASDFHSGEAERPEVSGSPKYCVLTNARATNKCVNEVLAISVHEDASQHEEMSQPEEMPQPERAEDALFTADSLNLDDCEEPDDQDGGRRVGIAQTRVFRVLRGGNKSHRFRKQPGNSAKSGRCWPSLGRFQ